MIFSVDTGNKQFKTDHFTFTTGINDSNTKPALTEDVLEYQGKYYTLSEKRMKYTREKYTDERFFILTLFGLGKEIYAQYTRDGSRPNPNKERSVTILLGLPLAHYSNQYEQFEKFFTDRNTVEFTYRDLDIKVKFDYAMTFVQGYAAIMPYEDILEEGRIIILDMGGFTLDIIKIIDGGIIIEDSKTLEMGVIPFYNKVIDEVNASYDLILTEKDIDAIILKDNNLNLEEDTYKNIRKIIEDTAQNHIAEIVRELREDKIDLRTYLTVFVGGGPLLLKSYIEKFKKERKTIGRMRFIKDINANCKGYKIMYKDFQQNNK